MGESHNVGESCKAELGKSHKGELEESCKGWLGSPVKKGCSFFCCCCFAVIWWRPIEYDL